MFLFWRSGRWCQRDFIESCYSKNSSFTPNAAFKKAFIIFTVFLMTLFFLLVSITMAPRKYFIHSAHYSLCLINATPEIRKVQFSISCRPCRGIRLGVMWNPLWCRKLFLLGSRKVDAQRNSKPSILYPKRNFFCCTPSSYLYFNFKLIIFFWGLIECICLHSGLHSLALKPARICHPCWKHKHRMNVKSIFSFKSLNIKLLILIHKITWEMLVWFCLFFIKTN